MATRPLYPWILIAYSSLHTAQLMKQMEAVNRTTIFRCCRPRCETPNNSLAERRRWRFDNYIFQEQIGGTGFDIEHACLGCLTLFKKICFAIRTMGYSLHTLKALSISDMRLQSAVSHSPRPMFLSSHPYSFTRLDFTPIRSMLRSSSIPNHKSPGGRVILVK